MTDISSPTHDGLRAKKVSVVYGSLRALDNADLHIGHGQILALLGASGSGKSTFLRAIAGLEPLQSGQIMWNHQDITHVPVYLREFGLMFQDGQLFPHRSVGGNVAYGLVGKMSREQRAERVTHMLSLVDLEGYEDRAISTLSGGQAQRVALARALAPQPRLLLLDEPLSALDKDLRQSLAQQLREILKKTSTTALLVTHDESEADIIADKKMFIDKGRIL